MLEHSHLKLGIKIDKLDSKLEAVYNQTAGLLEFKTETSMKLDTISRRISAVELIASQNWNDIVTLKAIK